MRFVCRITREGFEYQTGVNYLGHVELAKRLLEGLMLGQVGNSTPSCKAACRLGAALDVYSENER